MLVATRLDLTISIAAVALRFVVGAAIGAAAGYRGVWADMPTGRMIDTITAFCAYRAGDGDRRRPRRHGREHFHATAIITLPFHARLARAEVAARLEDGREAVGFLAEAAACVGAEDVTGFGGWRNWMRRGVTGPQAGASSSLRTGAASSALR